MPRSIEVAEHNSIEDLRTEELRATEAVYRAQVGVIRHLVEGKVSAEVAEITGFSRPWIWELVKRYNREGLAGLGDRRKVSRKGRPPLLNEEQQQKLLRALEGPAPDGGQWSGRKVAEWISEEIGRPVAPQRGWDWLKRLGFSLQAQGPNHVNADAEQQDAPQKSWHQKSSS